MPSTPGWATRPPTRRHGATSARGGPTWSARSTRNAATQRTDPPGRPRLGRVGVQALRSARGRGDLADTCAEAAGEVAAGERALHGDRREGCGAVVDQSAHL